jgi:hypothetical protein
MNAQLIVPAPRQRVAERSMTLVANAQLMFPDPLRLQFNILNLSAVRYRTVRSLAYKVRKRQETTAIAASKVCSPFPVPRRCCGQHLLVAEAAVAVMLAVVAPVVAAMVVMSGINFYPYEF